MRFRVALERGSWGAWLSHAFVLLLAIHTHYYALALVGLHALLAYRTVLWRPDRLRALASFTLVGILFVPWWTRARALDYGGWMPHVTFDEAVRRAAWAFAVGTSIYPEQGWTLAAPTLAAAGLGLLTLLPRRRGDALLLVGWSLITLLAAYTFGLFTGRASFHERYVSLGAPGLLALAGLGLGWALNTGPRWLVARRTRLAVPLRALRLGGAGLSLALGVGLAGAALAADRVSLTQHFRDPHFSKEDVRGAAAFIAPRATAADAMIGAPGRLWLYDRYGTVKMPTLETDVVWSPERTAAEVARSTGLRSNATGMSPLPLGEGQGERVPGGGASTRTIWLLPAGADVERDAERWLDQRAYRLDGRWFGLAPVKSWLVAPDPPARQGAALGPPDAPTLQVVDLGIALDDPDAPTRALRVAARWRKLNATPPLKLSLRLVDQRGRTAAQVDRPLGGDVWPIDRWSDGAEETLRDAMRLPPDLPAGRYTLRLVVYGDAGPLSVRPTGGPVTPEWGLGELDLPSVATADPGLLDPAQPDDRPVGPALRLVGLSLPATVQAGDRATVVLHWQALAPGAFGPGGLGATRLALGDVSPLPIGRLDRLWRWLRPGPATAAGAVVGASGSAVGPETGLAERTSGGVGALARDARELPIPRSLPAGRHGVVLIAGGDALSIGEVVVTAAPPRPRPAPPENPLATRFPGLAVAGYDLRGDRRPGADLTLALHLAPERAADAPLAAFVHLVGPDGKIAAQHDSPPCGGACPSTGWEAGDELLDEHRLALPPTLAPGRYRLLAGFYDPATGQRLRRSDGAPEGDHALITELDVP
jgi:hypothetical protein